MSVIKIVGLGTPNAGDGDPLRDGGIDINLNFANLNTDKLEKGGYNGTANDLFNLINAGGGEPRLVVNVLQAAHGFVIGQAVYIDSATGVYALAIATSAEAADIMGIVSEVTDIDNFTFKYGGIVDGVLFPSGEDLFLSTVVAGAINPEPTYTIGQFRQYVGTMTAEGLVLNIDIGTEITESGAVEWGGIGGDIMDQTDLITYIDTRTINGGDSIN